MRRRTAAPLRTPNPITIEIALEAKDASATRQGGWGRPTIFSACHSTTARQAKLSAVNSAERAMANGGVDFSAATSRRG